MKKFPPQFTPPKAAPNDDDEEDKSALIISPDKLRDLKRRKLKRRQNNEAEATTPNQTPSQLSSQSRSQVSPSSRTSSGGDQARLDLSAAVCSLSSKLEILQPEGMRPSDILVKNGSEPDQHNRDLGSGDYESGDVVLSQAAVSQQSVLLWEDLRVLVAVLSSTDPLLVEQAEMSVADLGLDALEDGVLHRLCVNEIFGDTSQDQKMDPAGNDESLDEPSLGLSYQSSMHLYRILFLQKATELKSIPSRLFLDAVLCASRGHGRAMVDGVLLPLVQDYANFSKFISELVQKALKEHTAASLIHFLSRILEPVSESPPPSMHGKEAKILQAALYRTPAVFASEIHLTTVQTLLGFTSLPCPVPSRLWVRLSASLELLWDQMVGLLSSVSTKQLGSTPPMIALSDIKDKHQADLWMLKLYCSPVLWEALFKSGKGQEALKDELRLNNTKLIQLLMAWTLRQGPHCQDVGSLTRFREFCATRLDPKLSKALVAKLDMVIKKKQVAS
ncbi:hypothetical protein BGZ74_011762 [Mortierella antarctica]|nr:hypothetical protein BGZ74_011762 [Mortierella antarctica]